MMPLAGTCELTVAMTLVGHSYGPFFSHDADGKQMEYSIPPVICYLPNGQKIISGSQDKTLRLWDLQTGKEMEQARVVCEKKVNKITTSRNGEWVVTVVPREDRLVDGPNELQARRVKTGITKTFEGHTEPIVCIDVSTDSKLLAGASRDGTASIWRLDTGELVAGPFGSNQGPPLSVRFSRDSGKLALRWVSSLEVRDIEGQTLVRRLMKSSTFFGSVLWTREDKSIITSLSSINRDIVRESEASTLETIGAPFQAGSAGVFKLALSFDGTLLAGSSYDEINLWAVESRQLLASFSVDGPWSVIFSPNAHQLAYTTHAGPEIYVCDISPDILTHIQPSEEIPSTNPHKNPLSSDPLGSKATTCRPTAHYVFPTLAQAPGTQQQQLTILHQLRKLLPFSFHRHSGALTRTVEPSDPLDCPATSRPLSGRAAPAPATTQVPRAISRSMPIQSSPPASTTISSPSHFLSNRRPFYKDHTLPSIVLVPYAQGRKRYAAAGGSDRGDNDGRVRGEGVGFRSSPPSPDSQQTSVPAQVSTGEHGGGRLCFCL